MGTLFLQFLMVMFIIGFINMIANVLKIRKLIKDNQDNPNVKGIAIVNGELKIIEEGEEPPKTIKVEPLVKCGCGKHIEKNNSYRLIKNEQEHHFCSWDCQEEFVSTME
ncbi:MAG: hypothetical protein ATN35_10250 [Epulopiscium sp. Nele67-Bin004]|nr:MAG: hypothetical protein ATN35_10250 [Epulopiscium sp. Nele67-Bin004]